MFALFTMTTEVHIPSRVGRAQAEASMSVVKEPRGVDEV